MVGSNLGAVARQGAAVGAAVLLLLAAAAAAAAPRPTAGSGLHVPGGAAPPGATQPQGVRLSFGDGPHDMAVTWGTRQPTGQPCVQFWVLPGGGEPGDPGGGGGRGSSSGGGGASQLHVVGPLLPGVERRSSSGSSGGGNGSAAALRSLLSAPAAPQPALMTACGGSTPFLEPATGAVSLHVHRVTLAGLPPGRALRYRCGSAAGGWSRWHASRSRRAPTQFSSGAPASLLVVGDMGLYNARAWPDIAAEAAGGGAAERPLAGGAQRAPVAAAPAAPLPLPTHDALLHIGDIAYDLGSLEGRRGAAFLRKTELAAAALPYLVAPGNHEWHANFSHYRALYSMPQRATSESLYYSFDLGPLHVLVYNTEAFFWPDLFGPEHMRAQWEWMEADLAAANAARERTPWILVAGHRPMYCAAVAAGGRCNEEHEASRLGLPSACPHNNPAACRPVGGAGAPSFPVEALLWRHGVDLAVYGHVHDYERYWPVHNHSVLPGDGVPGGAGGGAAGAAMPASSAGGAGGSTIYLNPRATIHVTSGAGGNSEMRAAGAPPPEGGCSAPWCAFQFGYAPAAGQAHAFSYSRLAVHNASHARWQQVAAGGRLVDEWWVVQERHGPFGT